MGVRYKEEFSDLPGSIHWPEPYLPGLHDNELRLKTKLSPHQREFRLSYEDAGLGRRSKKKIVQHDGRVY